MLWTTVLGTFMYASAGAGVVTSGVGTLPIKIVALLFLKMIGGCDRTVALTCTPSLGIMYDARPRSVVSTGSTARQFLGSGLSTFTMVAHVSLIARPVVVPPWSVRLPLIRAFTVTSTPCQ